VSKPLKITGDIDLMPIVVPVMMEFIGRGEGQDIGYTKNHHTAILELSDGRIVTAYAYETKSMIVISY
jgi:hypothetical protein